MTNGELQKEPTREVQAFGTITAERSAELASVAVASSAKAEVEAAYIMAMRNPRNEDDARAKILRACESPLFAQKARYRKPVGETAVIGPSIRFAEEMLRCWKNVLTQQTAIYDDSMKRIIRITTRDLEANTAYSKEISLEKTVERASDRGRETLGTRMNTQNKIVYIVRATEDELTIKESALASKVIRNNGLRLIPQHIIDEAMAVVEKMIKDRISKDPDAERRAILDGFSRRGIMPSDVERFVGCPSKQFTPDNLVTLRDMLTSIEDGHAVWSEYLDGTVTQTTEEIKEKSQPETKGKVVAEALKKTAEERGVKPTEQKQEVEQEPEPQPARKATDEAKEPEQAVGLSDQDKAQLVTAVTGTELKLRSTVEGTKKLNVLLSSMKVRLSGKQTPLDVIPPEQHEFYLDKLEKALASLK